MPAARIGAAMIVALALASPARGDATSRRRQRRACQDAYHDALALEAAAQLGEAKRLLRTCAQQKCGVFLEHQCTRRYGQVDADMPSVVPLVLDDAGTPVTEVTVRMDGVVLASELDGHALSIDPGLHEFTFETGDHVFARRKTLVLQGQRNLPLRASLPAASERTRPPEDARPPADPRSPADTPRPRRAIPRVARLGPVPPPEPSPPAHRSSVAGPLLLGVGLLGLSGGALLTSWGRKDNQLLAGCSPMCSPDAVEHIHQLYLAADVSLGAGLAALVAGAWLTWGRSDTVVEVQPGPGGALANVRGAF